jgi:hypothetical protein
MDKTKIIGFMLHLGEIHFDQHDILTALQQYDIGKYIIAKEEQPFIHYHVAVEMTTQNYNAFIAQYVSKSSKSNNQEGGLWQLRGRAHNGKPKQYGKILGIRSPDKLISYTVKQGIYITDVEAEWLKPYVDASFVKDSSNNDREIRDKMRDYIDKIYYKDHFKDVDDTPLKKAIIHFLLKEKIRIRTSSQIDGYFKYLRQFSNHDYIKKDCELYFYNLLYNDF